MRNLFTIILILSITLACKKTKVVDGIEFKEYVITKHRSTNAVNTVKDHNIQGWGYFSSSCEYELTENIGQINKLTGLSVGTDHQENSIRIGWVYENGLFDLYSYYYYQGERDSQKLTSVGTDELFNFKVGITVDGYSITINGDKTEIDAPFDELKTSYLLYPYFGGKEPFPNSLHGDKACKIYLKIFE